MKATASLIAALMLAGCTAKLSICPETNMKQGQDQSELSETDKLLNDANRLAEIRQKLLELLRKHQNKGSNSSPIYRFNLPITRITGDNQ